MDKTKKIKALWLLLCMAVGLGAFAQDVADIEFCDRKYDNGVGNETLSLFVNIKDADGERLSSLKAQDILKYLTLMRDGNAIDNGSLTIEPVTSGVRIPRGYTFSILLDQTIPAEGKEPILNALSQLIEMAPDSSVYVSMFGDAVYSTKMITADNFASLRETYMKDAKEKAFYSGVYAKLLEFSPSNGDPDRVENLRTNKNYALNRDISRRARENEGKNVMMIFVEGNREPLFEELDFTDVAGFLTDNADDMPVVNALYYTNRTNIELEDLLNAITNPAAHPELKGSYAPTNNIDDIVKQFRVIAQDVAYDYAISYNAEAPYAGNTLFTAKWGNEEVGSKMFTIGSAENPWPQRQQTTSDIITKLLVALLVTLVTFFIFFFIMKVIVPSGRSAVFRSKYYRKYTPQDNVQRRICHYCKQEITPGQRIVAKCSHWMHEHCWKENGYKCSEFGQNCRDGIQKHVDARDLFSFDAIKDCGQTLAGILAGLVSWIVYEFCGRGAFLQPLSEKIVNLVYSPAGDQASLYSDCVAKTSSFLMIGMLLGFFISLVFRYKDDIRDKSLPILLKILGLSIVTSLIGMLAFAIGADLFCLLLTSSGKTYIAWYCSLPAYVLFSICVSLALTISSTIPVKSALLGGFFSAVIGFLVLYFSKFTSARYDWLNMLLDFIIYGGGLGAALVTVRMLAERYFLTIQNGVKAGQRIPIHKWMNATGGGNKVTIGMATDCEIQMNWEKSNKVEKEHAQLFIDHEKSVPVIKTLAPGVLYNTRAELPVSRQTILSNGDTFKIGDTIFKYEEA